MTDENSSVGRAPVPTVSHIGNPVCVGVAGFALTTFTLGLYTCGAFDAKGIVLVFAFAAIYGGLVQMIAGFFALARGETFAGTFMTTYGAFWWCFVALNLYVVPHAGPAAGQAVLLFLIMWTVITVIFTITTLATNKVVFLAFLEFTITIILLDIAAATGNAMLNKVCGGLEMLLAAMAWYIVLAEMVNETAGKTVFPMFPFKKPVFGS